MGCVAIPPFLGAPEKVGMTLPILILSPFYSGPPRTHGLLSNSALLGAPEKVGMTLPVPILSLFYWGPSRKQRLRSIFAPLRASRR